MTAPIVGPMDTEVLTPLADDLWIMDGDRVRMLSIPFPTRAVIVRLSDGSLWVHSPVQATPERLEAVAKLGPVAHIVAPNKFHHLHVGAWQQRFCEAKTWAGPGLVARNPGPSFDAELGDAPEAEWSKDLDQLVFAGSFMLTEVIFLHRASKTLVLTDIVQNHDPAHESWPWRVIKRANNVLAPGGGAPRDWRLTVRDRDAARRSRDRMLAWDFDRLVISHGRRVETGAHAYVEQAFAWLD